LSVEQWTENPRVGSSILPLATTSDPSSIYSKSIKLFNKFYLS